MLTLFTATASFSAHAQAAHDVTAPVAALDQALDSIQQSGAGSFSARTQTLGPVVDQVYDLETVLRASVGAARYMQLSADDKQKLLATFRDYTVARYLSSFKKGSGAKFTLASDVRNSPTGGNKIVTTHIGSAENMPGTEIDYILHQEGGSWKIVDVLLDGHISQAAAQRSDFGSTLAAGGVDGLIAVLKKKVQTFSED
ncbi:toluene transporter [Acetobacter musti]|uniref:Toluene transporter n=2 Tax=Acetobacter musti TaxID=864732 RepID=A0ABX0JYW3_9PROT|nr:toluene transporter [Acetobacter musti]